MNKSKQHLIDVNESYFQHMRIAFKIGYQMLQGSLMAFIHGVIPGCFIRGASDKIKQLDRCLNQR